ncbi:hypothetical protein OIU77_012806 [Salix suchowensis]|uniref:SNF2 N-terminal domain-containing protein n=2 Tax=Salix suchowensis TaxID=1278906 RepID=A0ABQ9A688_9ROSI|nr:hypothetical protein OIU77_012806 [Salix suchowensis]
MSGCLLVSREPVTSADMFLFEHIMILGWMSSNILDKTCERFQDNDQEIGISKNDLKELWSLLNLLLPELFDNRKAFHDWFSKPFQREAPVHDGEDDWLETEKKVIIIHRLHQILEPFMLRRRVEDMEGSLPPKGYTAGFHCLEM